MTANKEHYTEETPYKTAPSNARQTNAGRSLMEALFKQKTGTIFLKPGDMAEGVVIERLGSKLFIDLGPYKTGIIYGREYYAAQDIIKNLKPGDKILAKVVDPDNEEGYVELSLKEAGQERNWLELKKKMEEGAVLELPVVEANRGGIVLEAEGIKGFLPASQLSSSNYPRVEGGDKEKIFEALQKFVGKTIRVKILDLDPQQNKLIFTERELDKEAMRAAAAKYKVGDIVEGEITGVVGFGGFMKFDPETNLEGLIHISEIDWTLIEDPRTVLKPGDKVKAKIIDIQGEKISFSLKALKDDPWKKLAQKYKKGDVVKGKVTKLNPFGAFVELQQEDVPIQGLVHVSEFGTQAKMQEEIQKGETYDFKILLIDAPEHRLSLGMLRSDANKNEPAHS